MKKVSIFSFVLFLLLIGTILFVELFGEFQCDLYFGNITSPSPRQLVHKKDSLKVAFESEYELIFFNEKDTILCYITYPDEEYIRTLQLIDDEFIRGRLYATEYPVKGYCAYLTNEINLVRQYEDISDDINIPNGLFTLDLSPTGLKDNYLLYRRHYPDLPRKNLLVRAYRNIRYSYENVDSVIYSHRRLPQSRLTDGYLYSDSNYPGIKLFYKRAGYTFETRNITQYPIVFLSAKQSEGMVVNKNSGQTVLSVEKYSGSRKFMLIRHDGGYLVCIRESKESIPNKALLDSLICSSNRYIKSCLGFIQ